MDWDRFLFGRFLLAIPELNFSEDYWTLASRFGWIKPEELDAVLSAISKANRYKRLAVGMKDKTIVERLLAVAPELMSVKTIDWMRRMSLVSVEQAHLLRIGLRGSRALLPGALSEATIGNRLGTLYGATVSNEAVNLIRDLDDARIAALRAAILRATGRNRLSTADAQDLRDLLIASIDRAQKMRAAITVGRVLRETVDSARAANNVWDAITAANEGLLSDRVLRAAIRAGAISPERYDLIRSLEVLGLTVWKRGVTAYKYESWAARALMLSEGVLSIEMINVLRTAGIISPELSRMLYPAATAIRAITRDKMSEYMTSRRFRVVPGEPPVKTFARSTQQTDRYLLKLLADAAQDAQKEAARLAGTRKFGAMTRAAQQRLIVNSLNQQMRVLWEGVGHLTIFGEREAARAALESMEYLQRQIWATGKRQGLDFERSIGESARAGVDSFISRQENIKPLSDRIYANIGLASTRATREVEKALLRGLGARDISKMVASLIRPGVPGGTSYAAMRLARTEINNAFHFTQIRYTREMPWVDGYKWHLSGSHPRPDDCNLYAERDHDGLGRGVFAKRNVPGKPHPNCLCYLTTVVASNGEFERVLRRGSYDDYLNAIDKRGTFTTSAAAKATTTRDASVDWLRDGAKVVAQAAVVGAAARAVREIRTSVG